MSEYKQGDVLALRWNVWISGTMLGIEKKTCIKSISIKETVDGADSATIVIADPYFWFIEDNLFIEDNKVRIMLGWSCSSYRVDFNGYISLIDIDFASDGVPVLTVTCMDNTHTMNREKKDRTFTDCTSADVVKRICSEHGYSCVVEGDYPFVKQETITQSGQTDIDFITKLAGDEVYPFTARLVGNTFYYVKKGKLETPVTTLTYVKYPHDIVSFKPKINKESKKVKINQASVSTSDKSVSTTTTSGGDNGGSGNVSPGGGNDTGGNNSSPATKTYDPVSRSWS